MKKMFVFCFALAFCAVLTGCSSTKAMVIDYVKPTVVEIAKTAWNVSGKAAVESKLNEMVKSGKITKEQAKLLSDAANDGFVKVTDKLSKETTSAEVEIADETISKK